jgi:hypothetical protein
MKILNMFCKDCGLHLEKCKCIEKILNINNMNKIEYKNRYGDVIQMEELEDGNILFIIPPDSSDYVRIGWESDEDKANLKYSMIDPSGGPYINKGYNMGMFHEPWNGKIVDHITPRKNDLGYILVIKND